MACAAQTRRVEMVEREEKRCNGIRGFDAIRDSMIRKMARVRAPEKRRESTSGEDQEEEVPPNSRPRRRRVVPVGSVRKPGQSRSASPFKREVWGVWRRSKWVRRMKEVMLKGAVRYQHDIIPIMEK
jgi:hypothetical protein